MCFPLVFPSLMSLEILMGRENVERVMNKEYVGVTMVR